MIARPLRVGFLIACTVLASTSTGMARAQATDDAAILERLRRLEQRQSELESLLLTKELSIRELEAELARLRAEASAAAESASSQPTAAPEPPDNAAAGPAAVPESTAAPSVDSPVDEANPFGEFTPGKGYTVARTRFGELNLSLYSYLRFLDQNGLDDTYVDHFGNTRPIDIREDFQVNKVFLYTKGWFLDPRFRYVFYVWGANTSLGQTGNVLVAGNMSYSFGPAFRLTGGVVGLPSTRSMMGQFPNWHRVDARLMADEFMRGSFTQGFAADGKITRGLFYNFTVGNNLNNFGVDAGELAEGLNSFAGALVWMPTTGEFGPNANFGDYEHHTEVATLFGLHATASTEDKQSQPGQDAPENTQLRLSDGALVFTPEVFAPGVVVNRLDYTMFAANAGLKYRGFALEGEVYYRILDNFRTNQPLALDQVTDKGYQLSASAMLVPMTLQAYVNGSQILGEYGDPWDAGAGINWWPFEKRGLRINSELLYLRKSPVGYASLPYPLGGNGWIWVTNAELSF